MWNFELRRTSIENKTPPMGDPNATATPAALAAVTISRILPDKRQKSVLLGKKRALTLTTRKLFEWPCNEVSDTACSMYGGTFFPNRKARCNDQGLSSCRVNDVNRSGENLTSVMLLMAKVGNPKNPCITNPARIHLISEIPEPAAYLARFLTRCAAINEKEDYTVIKLGRASV